MRKTFLIILVLLLVSCQERDRYIQVSGYAQGGTYTVKCHLNGTAVTPETVRDSIEAILHLIDTTLSGYNKGSLLSRFNAGERIRPNTLFVETYALSRRWFERSGGLLDFAAGPLYDAWGFGFRSGEMPSDEEVSRLVASSGMKHLPERLPLRDGYLDPADLGYPRLNYNAIAQGYSCDLVARYLYSIGVKDMLVDIGEIFCDGRNPSGQPWSVGVDRPIDGNQEKGAELSGIWSSGGGPAGIVTSGNYRKFYVRDGKKFAHTINPLTGYPVSHSLLSATVVAPDAASADALATWYMVIGEAGARELILSDGSLEGYLICAGEDGTMQEWASPGFPLVTSR